MSDIVEHLRELSWQSVLHAEAIYEIERLRGEVDIVNRTFQELCDALGCEYDNEAALMAIHALKHPEQ